VLFKLTSICNFDFQDIHVEEIIFSGAETYFNNVRKEIVLMVIILFGNS